jgi:hypothetical protein
MRLRLLLYTARRHRIFLFARECCAVRTQGESSPPHASMHHITVNAAIRATDHVSASRAFASLELAQHTAV